MLLLQAVCNDGSPKLYACDGQPTSSYDAADFEAAELRPDTFLLVPSLVSLTSVVHDSAAPRDVAVFVRSNSPRDDVASTHWLKPASAAAIQQ